MQIERVDRANVSTQRCTERRNVTLCTQCSYGQCSIEAISVTVAVTEAQSGRSWTGFLPRNYVDIMVFVVTSYDKQTWIIRLIDLIAGKTSMFFRLFEMAIIRCIDVCFRRLHRCFLFFFIFRNLDWYVFFNYFFLECHFLILHIEIVLLGVKNCIC